MSRENVEIARKCTTAFRDGDWDALVAHMDPHILIRTDPRWPEQYIYGLDAALAWWRGLRESGGADATITELVDLSDRVLARLRWAVHGNLSGIEVEQFASRIYTFRDKRVILEEWFLDHENALKAVGLEEQTVSQENVEILRAIYSRWARGDFWTPEVFDPEIEVVWSPLVPGMGTYHGLAGLEQSLREWFAAWGDIRMEAHEFIEVAPDRILVLVSARGRGQGSGITVEADDFAHEWTMRDGKATKLVGYADRHEALRAVGLEE